MVKESLVFSLLYTLSDLGVSSNLVGSLSRIMTLYSPPNAKIYKTKTKSLALIQCFAIVLE